jgi:hypothetical protein
MGKGKTRGKANSNSAMSLMQADGNKAGSEQAGGDSKAAAEEEATAADTDTQPDKPAAAEADKVRLGPLGLCACTPACTDKATALMTGVDEN